MSPKCQKRTSLQIVGASLSTIRSGFNAAFAARAIPRNWTKPSAAGNVLATLCDFTIASEKAVFGQVGPKVGSVDPGFGTAYLARVIGEKKAREIWYLCRATPRRKRSRWAWSTG